ncbi:MAG TPA: hypothetical protein VGK20_11540 [Candidatus Binatia bacterium]
MNDKASGRWAVVVALFGIGNLVNGLWMLASPLHWYLNLPANVPASGPLNEHFVRDIGCIFTLLGLALVVSVWRRELRLPAMVAASAYSVAHALVHIADSLRGLFEPGHWRFDLGPVYIATIVLVACTARLARDSAGGR